jgi:hypothetical protein
MRLAIAQLEEYGASIEEGTEGFSVIHGSGKRLGPFPRPRDASLLEIPNPIHVPKPAWAAQQFIKAHLAFNFHRNAINRNDELSDVARERRLQPVREAGAKTTAAIVQDFDAHKRSYQQAKVDRYVVSKLTPGDTVRQLEDMESRTWIRSASPDERTALLKTLGDANEEDAPLLEAVLRSRFAKIGSLEQVARAGWEKLIDRRDPVGLELLQHAQADIDWAERITVTVQHLLLKEIGFSREQLFPHVEHVAPLFGYSENDIKMMKARRV